MTFDGYQFDKCPRCGGEWRKTTPENNIIVFADETLLCNVCQMYVISGGGFGNDTLNFRCHIGSGELYWFPEHEYCTYIERTVDRGRMHIKTKLPFLPYDITAERLKLLLLFS